MSFLLVFLAVNGNIVIKKDMSWRSIRWKINSFESSTFGAGEEMYGILVGRVGKTMAWYVCMHI